MFPNLWNFVQGFSISIDFFFPRRISSANGAALETRIQRHQRQQRELTPSSNKHLSAVTLNP